MPLARTVETLFLEALSAGADSRERVLAACTDPELRAEVRELLESADQADGFFDEPPTLGLEPQELVEPAPPEQIGQFRILDVLGAGGMGVVYLAESNHPRRRVALKVIKPGIASKAILRRFEHETQVLALLQHPGIAAIYEAGTADTGAGPQPFFAMELVDGPRLSEYAAGLSVRDRLALFTRICDAVQHAHAKGVIHRDLKPANILVDESRQPKILDFGVARLGEHEAQMTSMQTDVGQLIGTLAYMSPEQVTGDPNAIDTRSDVYALGVILYQLLSGDAPHDIASVSMFEALRIIREDDPPSLGTQNREFKGDLDTIVHKALEKDRERRYETAAQFAADVRRYLRDEPILARPATTVYQLHKFAKRNRGIVGGAATTFLALIVGLVVAVHQRNTARLESMRLGGISDFTRHQFFRMADPEYRGGADPSFRDILSESAPRIEDLDHLPAVAGMLNLTWGEAFSNLDDLDRGAEHLTSSITQLTDAYGPTDARTVTAITKLARVRVRQNRFDEADVLLTTARDNARRRLGDTHRAVIELDLEMADLLIRSGHETESEPILRTLINRIEVARANAGALRGTARDEEIDQLDRDALSVKRLLGTCLRRRSDFAGAERLFREVYETRRDTLGPVHAGTLVAGDLLAGVLRDLERHDEAEALSEKTLTQLTTVLSADHSTTIVAKANMARSIFRRAVGDTDPQRRSAGLRRAAVLFDEVYEQRVQSNGPEDVQSAKALNDVGAVLLMLEEFNRAEDTFRDHLAIRRRLDPEGTSLDVAKALNNLSASLHKRVTRLAGSTPTLPPDLVGIADEAADASGEACAIADALEVHADNVWRRSFERNRALAIEAARRPDAESALLDWLERHGDARGSGEIAEALARLCTRENRSDEAAVWAERASRP